jgi:hypothetical protein
VISSSKPAETKPVSEAPKKLVTPSVFGNTAPKQEDKPLVKEPPKKLENPF